MAVCQMYESWGAYQILEEVALLPACELLGSCHHQIRRTDEYRCVAGA
jgi:hypothetical protein